MSVIELYDIAARLVADGHADNEVAIDFRTFTESENGAILTVEDSEYRNVQGADDSGPVGPRFGMLVLSGGVKWHEHGEPI